MILLLPGGQISKPEIQVEKNSRLGKKQLSDSQQVSWTLSLKMSSFPQTHRPSYGQIQSVLELYLRLLKANPIITKSITSGIIACAGSSLSQVGIAEFSFYLISNEILTSNSVFTSILFCRINIWYKTWSWSTWILFETWHWYTYSWLFTLILIPGSVSWWGVNESVAIISYLWEPCHR